MRVEIYAAATMALHPSRRDVAARYSLSPCLLDAIVISLALCLEKAIPFLSSTSEIMDYEGQKLAELIFYWIILSFGAVGWIIGYIKQDFTIVFQCWLVGVVLSVVVRPYCQRSTHVVE